MEKSSHDLYAINTDLVSNNFASLHLRFYGACSLVGDLKQHRKESHIRSVKWGVTTPDNLYENNIKPFFN